jgi:ubiquinone biosynthesis protein
MQVVLGLLASLFAIGYVFLLAALARRILGVPVGWIRSVVFGAVMIGVGGSVLTFVIARAHLVVDGRLTVNVAVAASAPPLPPNGRNSRRTSWAR